MIIRYRNIESISILPSETYPPLIVYSDAPVLSRIFRTFSQILLLPPA